MQYYELMVDPTGHFKGVEEARLLQACGLIPGWIMDWTLNHSTDLPLRDYLDQTYGFGLYDMGPKASIDADGVYRYPGDSDLYPLISFSTPIGKLYMYQYAIVAIPVEKDGVTDTFITRMD